MNSFNAKVDTRMVLLCVLIYCSTTPEDVKSVLHEVFTGTSAFFSVGAQSYPSQDMGYDIHNYPRDGRWL